MLRVHAYVLMDTHYHLLVETPKANLSQAMHHLNASYGNWFRQKEGLIGSVFQGRYKAILVEKDSYLKVLSSYIHLNPVRAGLAQDSGSFRFSSCRYYLGEKPAPGFLFMEELLSLFSGPGEYRRFLNGYPDQGRELAKDDVYGKNSLLGSDGCLRRVALNRRGAGVSIVGREIPAGKALRQVTSEDVIECLVVGMKLSEEQIWQKKSRRNEARKLAIYGVSKHTPLRLGEIGTLFGMDYAAVSVSIRRFELEIENTPRLAGLVRQLDAEVAKRRIAE